MCSEEIKSGGYREGRLEEMNVPGEKSDMQTNAHRNSDALVLLSIATTSTAYIINRITSQMYDLLTTAVCNGLI